MLLSVIPKYLVSTAQYQGQVVVFTATAEELKKKVFCHLSGLIMVQPSAAMCEGHRLQLASLLLLILGISAAIKRVGINSQNNLWNLSYCIAVKAESNFPIHTDRKKATLTRKALKKKKKTHTL